MLSLLWIFPILFFLTIVECPVNGYLILRYRSKSTVLGAKPHLSPSLTPLSRETANQGCFGKEG
jgi:hypothetical protein